MGGYTGRWVEEWNEDYQADPRPQVGDIYSGLRAPVGSRAKDVTSPCQYWIKGMPGICKSFNTDTSKCTAESDGGGKYPTGYNNGKCDYLGRRNWCSHYECTCEDLEEYICIAPDMFRTGLGKRNTDVTTHLELVPYPKSEILGYNENDAGIGKCDGLGMGRGKGGEGITDPEKMYELPIICGHYKPWMMGFGAVKPRPMGTAILAGRNIYDGSVADPLTDMGKYLPFSFRMLNLRAYYQKCAHWDQDYGTNFEMDYSGGYATIELPEDPLTECTCTDNACIPYKTITEEWPEHGSDTLVNVLTKEGGVVCNGANSECPCYTGKWYFCIADNMRDGMRITAEQILEIRFWTAVWQTKEIYDSIFAEKSGPLDITTSDIFTFDKWEKLGAEVMDSVMKGKRIYQCFPIPYNQRMFDPEVYLTKEAVTYPKANAKTGTSDSKQSSFPTLIRKVDETDFVPPLDVIYPYQCKDPWSVEPCDKNASKREPMEIASCKMEPPATAVFGYTVRNKNVYALNTNKIGGEAIFLKLKDSMVSFLPEKEREKVNASIRYLIDTSMESCGKSKYIVSGTSNKYGYFGIGPLLLDYNTTTTIAVIVELGSEYEVVIRGVKSKFYGGAIIQNNFEFKYSGEDKADSYGVTLPTYFSPPAKLSGEVKTFGGNVHSVFPVYSLYSYGIVQDTAYYSYCVNEYTVGGFDAVTTQWVRIGPTGYIWAEIDNIDISYLFDFEVTKAYIERVPVMGVSGWTSPICGEYSGGKIELEVVRPKTGDPDAIKRKHLLPGGVLLKSSDPQGFFNEDWTLHIEYKYKKLESSKPSVADSGAKTVWPTDLDKEGLMNKFVDPPFTFKQESRSRSGFEIENIGVKRGTIAIMAYIEDDDGRIQAATATKMLLDIVTTRCRGVDIFYSYRADAKKYDLIPNSGFFTWKGGDLFIESCKHINIPIGGDHECNPYRCIGPVWFPFSNCQTYDFYNFCQGPSVCNYPVEGGNRNDYRYRMADEYKAYTRSGGNWAAACGNGWYYSYSHAGKSQFVGCGNIKTSVDLFHYAEIGWTPPPFGNDGRECTERWLSQEFCGFWDFSGPKIVPRAEYMPLVFDDDMLFTSFDAFEEQGLVGGAAAYFRTTCMLNYMSSELIGEKMIVTYTDVNSSSETARFRFEDLFEIISHRFCMYPPPLYDGGEVKRYGFKTATVNEKETKTSVTGHEYDELVSVNKGVAWAWREYWKDIERGVDGDIFNFVYLNRPPYYVDFTKIEHRLTTDEGNVNIIFTAPIGYISEKGSSKTLKRPKISIEGGYPREFEIIYDNYDDGQVEWLDEGGDGVPDSSGGDDDLEGGGGEFGGGGASGNWNGDGENGDGIYEEAMGSGWFHDDNTIFDVGASAEISDARKIVFGETSVGYNRGLIANIPKNRLAYLPYKLKKPVSFGANRPPDSHAGKCQVWYNKSKTKEEDIIFTFTGGACIMLVTIGGKIGIKERSDWFSDAGTYCQPEITISECSVDDVDKKVASTILYKKKGKSGEGISEKGEYYKYLEDYNLEIKLNRLPKRVLYESPLFQVKCTLFPGQHLRIGLELTPGEYVDAMEVIKVWERKYVISTMEGFGDENPDGSKSSDIRSYDRNFKNAGQYFPPTDETYEKGIKCFDKMTMINMGKRYDKDESLEISMGSLKEIEAEEQKKLYKEAYNKEDYDKMTYTVIVPPNVQQFFNANNINLYKFNNSCEFISEKLPWDKHELVNSFQQGGDFWQAGGHYYVWGPDVYRTRCYIIGPMETVYSPVFVHYNHTGGNEKVMDPHHAYVGWARLRYYNGKWVQEMYGENSGTRKRSLDLLTIAQTGITSES